MWSKLALTLIGIFTAVNSHKGAKDVITGTEDMVVANTTICGKHLGVLYFTCYPSHPGIQFPVCIHSNSLLPGVTRNNLKSFFKGYICVGCFGLLFFFFGKSHLQLAPSLSSQAWESLCSGVLRLGTSSLSFLSSRGQSCGILAGWHYITWAATSTNFPKQKCLHFIWMTGNFMYTCTAY